MLFLLRRRVQTEGLQTEYNDPDDRSVKEAVHMLFSLAFVPVDDVVAVYEELYDDIPEEVVPIASYFEETYVRGRRGRVGELLFLPDTAQPCGIAMRQLCRT